jgi:hypothetical protein
MVIVVQRLDTDRIAGQQKLPLLSIQNGEREHPVEQPQKFLPMFLVEMQ